jgi:predicted DNA-binding protein YlxM (UPF0122 family)
MKDKIYTVYSIQNIENKKIYIGRSVKYKARWSNEICAAFDPNNQDYKTILSKAFRKYAKIKENVKNKFSFLVLEQFSIFQDSVEAEKFWISFFRTNVSKYGSECGYNLTEGGEGALGYKQTDEHKRKISDKTKKGENCPSAKLKQIDAYNIRKQYLTGIYSTSKLAKKYNVSKKAILNLIHNKTYKDNNYNFNDFIEIINKNKKTRKIFRLVNA